MLVTPPETSSSTFVASDLFSANIPQVFAASKKLTAAFFTSSEDFSSFSKLFIMLFIVKSSLLPSFSIETTLSIKTATGFIMSNPKVIIQSSGFISETSIENFLSIRMPLFR